MSKIEEKIPMPGDYVWIMSQNRPVRVKVTETRYVEGKTKPIHWVEIPEIGNRQLNPIFSHDKMVLAEKVFGLRLREVADETT